MKSKLLRVGRPCALALTLMPLVGSAQVTELKVNTEYACAGDVLLTIFSCAGAGAGDTCDVQTAVTGKPSQRGPATRQQIAQILPVCREQGKVGTRSARPSAPTPRDDKPDANGFRIGETVSAATAMGMVDAKILQADGDRYLVRIGSTDVRKDYPSELRRVGPLTDVDKARGLFVLHEKVALNVEGKNVTGEVIGEMGMEYNVRLVDGRTAWAKAPQLRRLAVIEAPAPKPGTPPQPGLKACPNKMDGRYALTHAVGANVQITFRSGKATMTELSGSSDYECWTDGKKILLHEPGSELPDLPIDINDDGTLETPFGELKKKGS